MHQQSFLHLCVRPEDDATWRDHLHLLGVGVAGLNVQAESQLFWVGQHLCEHKFVEVGLKQLHLRL